MHIPSTLIEKAKKGELVLFLGAGASCDAVLTNGNKMPGTQELTGLLSDRFLGGKFRSSALSFVADLCGSQDSIDSLELYIKDLFTNATPTSGHKILPTLQWAGIATTNYDCLLEDSYRLPGALQKLKSSVSDFDRASFDTRSPDVVELLKLHGCITAVPDQKCPLILTVEQYTSHLLNRNSLFARFQDWASRWSVLFIGTSLQDYDIVNVLKKLPSTQREECFFVAPTVDNMLIDHYQKDHISAVKGTFSEFMIALDKAVPRKFRSLSQAKLELDHPIEDRFVRPGVKASTRLAAALDSKLLYLSKEFRPSKASARDFFRGSSPPFEATFASLDARRDLQDPILESLVLDDHETDQPSTLTVVLGPAGCGKSVLIERIAWSLAFDFDRLVLYGRPGAPIPHQEIEELVNNTNEPVYLVIDNACEKVEDILSLVSWASKFGKPVHTLAAERLNEIGVSAIDRVSTGLSRFELSPLSHGEASRLIEKLEENSCLGHLEDLEHSDQIKALTKPGGADGDLLVAVYRATFGAELEAHLVDEYRSVPSDVARSIYLTICALNRLNILVRAGTIFRVHGVSYTKFRTEFLRPLERIVFDRVDANKDVWYKARHSVVASIVFDKVLVDDEDRLHCLLNCLDGLDAGYDSDKIAIQRLAQHDSVKSTFRDAAVARAFYDELIARFSADPYVAHQAAVYELSVGAPDFERTAGLIRTAKTRGPDKSAIRHTEAVLHLRLGQRAHSTVVRNKEFKIAEDIALSLKGSRAYAFPYHTLAIIAVHRLMDVIANEADGDVIEKLIYTAESNIQEGSQLFPENEYIIEAEAALADALLDGGRAQEALRKVLKKNPKRVTAALSLARMARKKGDVRESISILELAQDAVPLDLRVRLALAENLVERGWQDDNERIRSLAESCFGPGTQNPKAQILAGRQLLLLGRKDEANSLFVALRRQDVEGGKRWRLYKLPNRVRGRIRNIDPFVGVRIETEEVGLVYAYLREVNESVQPRLNVGAQMTFEVAFSTGGPIAVSLDFLK